ncbi:MAG TPA: RES family NAD+ phosphorylase [Microthrixaceae bacterium]|nr:RES family NAD+ phosphorylase [Microthrixaceae bacterium]
MTLRDPYRDISKFPVMVLAEGTALWRVTKREFAAEPWFFATDANGRFNLVLPRPEGTCYFADDAEPCVAETLWRDREPTGDPDIVPDITAEEAANYCAVRVTLERDYRCADLTFAKGTRISQAFGFNSEINTSVSYLYPQQWADAFAEEGLDGVAYVASRTSGASSYALFGPAGQTSTAATEVHELSPRFLNDHNMAPARRHPGSGHRLIADNAEALAERAQGRVRRR